MRASSPLTGRDECGVREYRMWSERGVKEEEEVDVYGLAE